jgi:hypothetical protein
MVTILDIGLLQTFEPIFAVLFVFTIMLAILQKTKALSEAFGINGIISAVIGIMVLMSSTLVSIITFMIPWFTVVIIFFVLLLLVFQVFGAKDADFASAVKDKGLMWTIIGVGVVILLAAVGSVIPEDIGPNLAGGDVTSGSTSSSGFSSNLTDILFNPKIIGIIVIFLVAIFAIVFLSGGY